MKIHMNTILHITIFTLIISGATLVHAQGLTIQSHDIIGGEGPTPSGEPAVLNVEPAPQFFDIFSLPYVINCDGETCRFVGGSLILTLSDGQNTVSIAAPLQLLGGFSPVGSSNYRATYDGKDFNVSHTEWYYGATIVQIQLTAVYECNGSYRYLIDSIYPGYSFIGWWDYGPVPPISGRLMVNVDDCGIELLPPI